ncbi:MAG: SUF system NifU family Fe-S cluster assembly protein [Bacilli bacterium]|nr:SUF system NifU family Fe-S cluster assembly protein [Bacilli bacterium]
MDDELKRSIILDNFSNPKNKRVVDDPSYLTSNTNNESCIDNIDLFVKVEDGKIVDICFNGEACAISTSSTSIMIKNLIGKTIKEAKAYVNNFEAMVNEEAYDEELLNDAIVYEDIYKQKNRVKCATLPYTGIKKIINNLED